MTENNTRVKTTYKFNGNEYVKQSRELISSFSNYL